MDPWVYLFGFVFGGGRWKMAGKIRGHNRYRRRYIPPVLCIHNIVYNTLEYKILLEYDSYYA